jgi:hypothetical protein
MTSRDMENLALRIDRLQQTRTHDWDNGDALEFRNLLPNGYDRRKVPEPAKLRLMAFNRETPSESDWRMWVTMVSRMEGSIHRNDPRNPQRMIRDMMRGKRPMY